MSTKTKIAPGSKFSVGEYKGFPMVVLELPPKTGKDGKVYVDEFQFGLKKAAAILEHLDEIARFVHERGEFETPEAPKPLPKASEVASGRKATAVKAKKKAPAKRR